MSDFKRMPVAEFRSLGYLQEINRLFLHPLGLALEVVSEEDGSERFGGVWDYRDDPEGIVFGDDDVDPEMAARVADELTARVGPRQAAVGYVIQPVREQSSP